MSPRDLEQSSKPQEPMPSATIGRRCTPASRLPSGMPNSRLNVRTLVEQALSELTEYAKAIARASSATLLRSTLNKQTKSDPTAQAMLITLLRSVGRHLRDAIMNPMTAEAAIRLRWLRCSAGHQRRRQSKKLACTGPRQPGALLDTTANFLQSRNSSLDTLQYAGVTPQLPILSFPAGPTACRCCGR